MRRQNYEGIFYYKTISGKEVDFVAQEINGKISLFQVCIDLNDEKTKQREINALLEATTELKINHAYIITHDINETIEIDKITIKIIPYWAWVIESYGEDE